MEKTILIAGKNMPEAGNFASGIALLGRNIVVTGEQSGIDEGGKRLTVAERKANQAEYEEEKSREAKSGTCTIEWSKSSPLSSRSLVLQTITLFGQLDEAILYFDEEWFAGKAEKMNSEEIARGCDEMIAGYQYLALEVISTFQRREKSDGAGTLVFLLKETPSRIDALNSPALKDGLRTIASPLVSAGAAAFASFAENLAAVCHDSIFANILLIRGDSTMNGFRRDDETGRFVCKYLGTEDGEKAAKSAKWIKPGEKLAPVKKRGFFGR